MVRHGAARTTGNGRVASDSSALQRCLAAAARVGRGAVRVGARHKEHAYHELVTARRCQLRGIASEEAPDQTRL